MNVAELDTPVVTIDLDVMAHNIQLVQAYCDQHGIRLRPHIKTHKIPAIGHLQKAAGAQGITCQKLGEAEVFAAAGFDDIFIPYNLLGAAKLERLMRLSRQARVSAAVDSAYTARGIAAAAQAEGLEIPLLIECDTGAHRAGVQLPDEALALAQEIERLRGVRFEGLMAFPTLVEGSRAFFEAALPMFARAGIPVHVVSGGGTPQTWRTHEVPQVTEHRAGTYVFNDRNTMAAGTCAVDECAMRVIMTVVSRPTKDRAILDGGSKTLSSDRLLGSGEGYGLILEYPEAVIDGLSEEHGHVSLSASARQPELGERVTVIPNHCCATTNMHDQLVGVRNGRVDVIWPVLARGKVQ